MRGYFGIGIENGKTAANIGTLRCSESVRGHLGGGVKPAIIPAMGPSPRPGVYAMPGATSSTSAGTPSSASSAVAA